MIGVYRTHGGDDKYKILAEEFEGTKPFARPEHS
jgi:hypothetical protein